MVLYDSTSAYRRLIKKDEGKPEEKSLSRHRPEENVLSRKRRALATVGKVLILTSLATSTANIAWDAFLTYGGCCEIHKVCEKQMQIKTLKTEWNERADDIDQVALEASKKITFIDSIHTSNQIIQTKLIRIIEKVDELVSTLSGNELNMLKDLQDEVNKIRADNQDVMDTWTLQNVDLAFQGLWASDLGRIQLFAPLFLELGSHGIGMLWQEYKVKQISKALGDDMMASILRNTRTQYGGVNAWRKLGRPQLNNAAFLKETALARYQASKGAGSKFATFAQNSFTLLTIGLEAWHIYENTKRCAESADKIKEMHEYMTEEVDKLDAQEVLVQEAKTESDTAYTTLTESISSEDFLDGIQNIWNLVNDASTKNSVTTQTLGNLTLFLNDIEGAVENSESSKIEELQDTLSWALNNVTYTYDCYLEKAKAVARVIDSCKSGADSLTAEYEKVKNELLKCVVDDNTNTAVYMSYETLEKSVIDDANLNGYSAPDCSLNDPDKKALICLDFCDWYPDVDDVAEEHGITVAQVNTLCKATPCELTRREKRSVCGKIKDSVPIEDILTHYPDPFHAAIRSLYNDVTLCD